MRVYLISPPRSPLARFVGAVVAVLVLAGAFMLGLAALAVLLGIALVVAVTAWVRAWWLTRTGRAPRTPGAGKASADDSIEAEYTVIASRREERSGTDSQSGPGGRA